MCIQLRTRSGILTLQILLAQLGATGHQDDAEHIGATSVADAPERVAPVVSFDELGVAGREELGGKVATLGKLRRDDVGHHANADAVPVSPDVDAAASLLGGTRALRRRNAIMVGTIGGLRSLKDVMGSQVGLDVSGIDFSPFGFVGDEAHRVAFTNCDFHFLLVLGERASMDLLNG